jgi:hypothetical protein
MEEDINSNLFQLFEIREKIEPPIIIGNQVFRRRMKINKWYTY